MRTFLKSLTVSFFKDDILKSIHGSAANQHTGSDILIIGLQYALVARWLNN